MGHPSVIYTHHLLNTLPFQPSRISPATARKTTRLRLHEQIILTIPRAIVSSWRFCESVSEKVIVRRVMSGNLPVKRGVDAIEIVSSQN